MTHPLFVILFIDLNHFFFSVTMPEVGIRRPQKFGRLNFLRPRIYIFKYAWSEQKVCIICIMLHIVHIISLLYLKIRDSYSNNHNVPYLRIPSLIILHEALYLSIYHICLYSIYLSIYLMRKLPGTCASLSIYPSPPIRRENHQKG